MMSIEQLRESFSGHEVETTEELLHCLKGPCSADVFRRMLLLFLRGHYSSADNYMGFTHLNCYTWHPDEKLRKLEIEFTHQASDRKPDAYPGIYVEFAKVDFAKAGVGGNFAGNSEDRAGTHVSKIATANYVIHHVAKNPSDAYDLADLSSRVLTAMATPLAMNGGATEFEVLGYGPPQEKNPSPEYYYKVAMPVQISYTHAVTRSLESHRIRQIAQVITAES